ncbi:MAG: cbb3-type cytochrome oxidase assembly protein CcoS [Mesorhizobium sp.]|jgi:cbb3-type cytochrome oxidase maturation protein|nr:cbb3-type cytochrome oxidase assembly protein CcoS [Mesorhizobium sp.]MBL8577255.1 cbb3-type cytochrome oxidase assembly protein CcoS [Mesorhizobium sp.]
MSSLVYLVPLALVLGGGALAAFLWSLQSGQYEDLDGAAERILLDDDEAQGEPKSDREFG